MLTMPEFAFLALCRLAKPLASPGPRCSSVEAGVPFMRKYPSAAPVTTPSNRPSTQRMPSTRSRAATKCISEVPGLAKQTSTPPATKVRTRLSAPFMLHSRRDASLFSFCIAADQSLLVRFVKLFPDIAAIIGTVMRFHLSFEHRSPRGIAACEIAPGMASFAVKPIFLRTKMIRAYILLFAAVTMLGSAGQAQAEGFDTDYRMGGGLNFGIGRSSPIRRQTVYF